MNPVVEKIKGLGYKHHSGACSMSYAQGETVAKFFNSELKMYIAIGLFGNLHPEFSIYSESEWLYRGSELANIEDIHQRVLKGEKFNFERL